MALMERLSIFITFVLMPMGRFFVSSVITDVRLFNGPASNKGTIEIRQDWGWETTCGSVLDIEDVMVICRQLGFPGASRAINNTPYADGYEHSLSTLGLDCRGDESHLSKCPLSQSSPCTPAAASCYANGQPLPVASTDASNYIPLTKPSPCQDSTAWTTAILIVGIILALAVLYGNIIITLMYLNHRRSKYALKGKDDGNMLPELEPMHDDVK